MAACNTTSPLTCSHGKSKHTTVPDLSHRVYNISSIDPHKLARFSYLLTFTEVEQLLVRNLLSSPTGASLHPPAEGRDKASSHQRIPPPPHHHVQVIFSEVAAVQNLSLHKLMITHGGGIQ